jgi:serine/threonine protein kinase
MELLGPTVQNVRRACPGNRLSKSTTTRISLEMLSAIEACHKHNVLHRDIKPSNFVFRVPQNEHLVILDFGLARQIFDPTNGAHFCERETKGIVGTCRYQSFHGGQKKLMTRRDDLISWFYSVVELADGVLPWPGSSNREETFRLKMEISPAVLAKSLPVQFVGIWEHISGLEFAEEPNYDWIKEQIREALEGAENDPLDWLLLSHAEIHALWSHEVPIGSNERSTCVIA